jgi:hypothetical protein
MKYCEKCKVNVRGKTESCPLCQNKLSGTEEVDVFPRNPTIYKQFQLFFKLLILGTVSGGVISVAVNLMIPKTGFWSLFVVLGIVCFWISLAFAVRKRNNIPWNITNQVVILSILSIVWDYLTGWHKWSFDFVIPVTCIVAMISLAVIGKVMNLPVNDYIVYLTADIAFGIVPLVFYFTGFISIILPTMICITFSILSFTALLLFEGKTIQAELTRRFHV